MRARILLVVLLAGAMSAAATAATRVVDGRLQLVPSTVPRPHRSQTMRQVEQRFGAPERRYPAVGRPPITRWDYPAFSVYFEYNRVVHAVVHAAAAN